VLAYTVNRLGTWFSFIALAVAVFDHTHSALAVAALLIASQVLPAFAVPALVARVEASSRRGELAGLYLFEAATTATLAVLLLSGEFLLPVVLLLVALDGTAALAASALLRAAAARSAREWARAPSELQARLGRATLPAPLAAGTAQSDGQGELANAGTEAVAQEAVEVDAERRANAALNMGFAVTFTLGPALAGLVVPAFGVPAALLIDTASFVVCGALVINLTPHTEDAENPSVRARLRAAWRYINDASTLRRLLLTQAIALVFFEFSPPIEVAYAKVSLHAGDSGYGLLLGVWGLGVAIGSIVFVRSIERSLAILLGGSTLAVGVAYLGWAVAPTLPVACIAGLVGGVGNGVQWAALISAVQRLTPNALQGRMMGAVESIGAISPGVGFGLGSGIVALSSPRTAFLVAGIGATICTAAFLRLPIADYVRDHVAPADAAGAREDLEDEPPVIVLGNSPLARQSEPRVADTRSHELGLAGAQPPSSGTDTP
jgi:predicted MFS family arabinose efflux permease